jgi:hypothetical protein
MSTSTTDTAVTRSDLAAVAAGSSSASGGPGPTRAGRQDAAGVNDAGERQMTARHEDAATIRIAAVAAGRGQRATNR